MPEILHFSNKLQVITEAASPRTIYSEKPDSKVTLDVEFRAQGSNPDSAPIYSWALGKTHIWPGLHYLLWGSRWTWSVIVRTPSLHPEPSLGDETGLETSSSSNIIPLFMWDALLVSEVRKGPYRCRLRVSVPSCPCSPSFFQVMAAKDKESKRAAAGNRGSQVDICPRPLGYKENCASSNSRVLFV